MVKEQNNRQYETRRFAPAAEMSAPRAGATAREQVAGWCQLCGQGAGMISFEQAAGFGRLGRRRVRRWLEEGQLHSTTLSNGALLICGRSLVATLEYLDATTRDLLATQEMNEGVTQP